MKTIYRQLLCCAGVRLVWVGRFRLPGRARSLLRLQAYTRLVGHDQSRPRSYSLVTYTMASCISTPVEERPAEPQRAVGSWSLWLSQLQVSRTNNASMSFATFLMAVAGVGGSGRLGVCRNMRRRLQPYQESARKSSLLAGVERSRLMRFRRRYTQRCWVVSVL
jgi:hypothetical protein